MGQDNESNEGVSYLRALKQMGGSSAAAAAAPAPDHTPEEHSGASTPIENPGEQRIPLGLKPTSLAPRRGTANCVPPKTISVSRLWLPKHRRCYQEARSRKPEAGSRKPEAGGTKPEALITLVIYGPVTDMARVRT